MADMHGAVLTKGPKAFLDSISPLLRMTPDDVFSLAERRLMRFGDLVITMGSQRIQSAIPDLRIAASDGGGEFVDAGCLREVYESGATLTLLAVETALPEVAGLVSLARKFTGMPASANLFLTKGSQPGLAAHFDDTYVVALPLGTAGDDGAQPGFKQWQLGSPPVPFAVQGDWMVNGWGESKEMRDVVSADLKPGHVLELPPGVPHTTSVIGAAPAMHLAIAPPVSYWSAHFRQVLSASKVQEVLGIPGLPAPIPEGALEEYVFALQREVNKPGSPLQTVGRKWMNAQTIAGEKLVARFGQSQELSTAQHMA
jgi:hypothetical protein